ncbi:hypothetical protein ACCO45_011222 [Purpureocillium lilacinum]|uniref:Uncharacterized protein n=1 Tax=Purpureocillium lilacinum TaxID=33203 RepID=A0ACC4DIH3_PURLI
MPNIDQLFVPRPMKRGLAYAPRWALTWGRDGLASRRGRTGGHTTDTALFVGWTTALAHGSIAVRTRSSVTACETGSIAVHRTGNIAAYWTGSIAIRTTGRFTVRTTGTRPSSSSSSLHGTRALSLLVSSYGHGRPGPFYYSQTYYQSSLHNRSRRTWKAANFRPPRARGLSVPTTGLPPASSATCASAGRRGDWATGDRRQADAKIRRAQEMPFAEWPLGLAGPGWLAPCGGARGECEVAPVPPPPSSGSVALQIPSLSPVERSSAEQGPVALRSTQTSTAACAKELVDRASSSQRRHAATDGLCHCHCERDPASTVSPTVYRRPSSARRSLAVPPVFFDPRAHVASLIVRLTLRRNSSLLAAPSHLRLRLCHCNQRTQRHPGRRPAERHRLLALRSRPPAWPADPPPEERTLKGSVGRSDNGP